MNTQFGCHTGNPIQAPQQQAASRQQLEFGRRMHLIDFGLLRILARNFARLVAIGHGVIALRRFYKAPRVLAEHVGLTQSELPLVTLLAKSCGQVTRAEARKAVIWADGLDRLISTSPRPARPGWPDRSYRLALDNGPELTQSLLEYRESLRTSTPPPVPFVEFYLRRAIGMTIDPATCPVIAYYLQVGMGAAPQSPAAARSIVGRHLGLDMTPDRARDMATEAVAAVSQLGQASPP